MMAAHIHAETTQPRQPDWARLAEIYDDSPVVPNGRTARTLAHSQWSDYGRHCIATYERLKRHMAIVETTDPEPYVDHAAQSADIEAGRYLVSVSNDGDHPFWTVRTNTAFRVVHDVLGHHAGTHSFDRFGEIGVYVDALHSTPWARRVLFSESVLQLAYAIDAGTFHDIQKAI